MGIVQGKNPTAVISELVPLVAPLGDVFTGAGFEIALVGGPVRDALLGQAPHDLDLTTCLLYTSPSPRDS